MIFLGLPRDKQKKYYFESLKDIKSKNKGLQSEKKTNQTKKF